MSVIQLRNSPKLALVDDDAPDEVFSSKWYLNHAGYAERSRRRGRHGLLHRLVMNAPIGMFVDHRDRDPMNNCRSNLRVVTPAESSLNKGRRAGTSTFRGVSWNPKSRKWCVYLNQKYIGLFADELVAAEVWIAVAAPVYGEDNVSADRDLLKRVIEQRRATPQEIAAD